MAQAKLLNIHGSPRTPHLIHNLSKLGLGVKFSSDLGAKAQKSEVLRKYDRAVTT